MLLTSVEQRITSMDRLPPEFDAWLTKPVSLEELVEALNTWLPLETPQSASEADMPGDAENT